jgi:hypothetical protein
MVDDELAKQQRISVPTMCSNNRIVDSRVRLVAAPVESRTSSHETWWAAEFSGHASDVWVAEKNAGNEHVQRSVQANSFQWMVCNVQTTQ